MAKFKVTDVRKIPSGDDHRVGKFDYLITYSLDTLHTYMVTIPKDNITQADIVEAVRRDLDNFKQFTGMELET